MAQRNPARRQPDQPQKPPPQRKPEPETKRNLDIVEEAGKESFPASDAPSWTP